MGKYKFDFRQFYSFVMIIACLCLIFVSDVLFRYAMTDIKSELIPLTDKNSSWNILYELIPATNIEEELFGKTQEYIQDSGASSSKEVIYLARQYLEDDGTYYHHDISGDENTFEGMVEDNGSATGDASTEEAVAVGDTVWEAESTEAVMEASAIPVSSAVTYSMEQLMDFEFLVSNCYLVDSSTSVNPDELDANNLLGMDMSVDLSGEDYKVLIYHTHGSEAFADSRPGVTEDTVIGVGDELERLLNQYGIKVYHDRNVYDTVDGVLDRSRAYDLSGDSVDDILAQYPSIEVVIDLHRDGVREDLHLVTDINGVPTAKLMFVNGVSRLNVNGDIDYLYNPNKIYNLAFSLQMYLEGKATYGDLMRRIYVRGYCFNLDKAPRAALVEVGAQTNTVAEAKNAMIPLADIIYKVLSGSE